jgi:Darcynin, domain of unknown function
MRTEPQHWAFFMLVRATRAWLDLTFPQRTAFVEEKMKPLLIHAEVRLRYFDAEYFHAKVSDVLLWETTDPVAYQAVIQGLRDTVYWNGYFDIVDIIPAVEDDYAAQHGIAAFTDNIAGN